jgi:hypothetical protein
MADYRGDLLSFEAVLDRALLTASLPHLHVMIDPHSPSAVRVLAKSMHAFAVGWIVSVGWLWIATVQQHLLRRGVAPDAYALNVVLGALIPAALLACVGYAIDRWAGRAPSRRVHRREWHHAFWWTLMPNALLLVTIWVMIQEGQ